MSDIYRPSQWSGLPADESQRVYMRNSVAGYFFDAILKVEHTTRVRATEHPIQTGANVTDHAYMEPAHVVMDIGMSDAMDSVVSGQFSSGETKSIGAYKKLLELQKKRETVKLVTRLNSYDNMLIETVHAPDDAKTYYGLRCTVFFREIMIATVDETKVSTQPQVSQETNQGTIQATPVPSDVESKLEEEREGTTSDTTEDAE